MVSTSVSPAPTAVRREDQTVFSFDHFVGERKQTRRHRETERLGGLEIYHQIEFGRLLGRKVFRLGASAGIALIHRRKL